MRRVSEPVTLAVAKERLIEYRSKYGAGPHPAAWLAEVIWPGTKWVRPQGAGAASTRVLKRLGCYWSSRQNPKRWGWVLSFPSVPPRPGGAR